MKLNIPNTKINFLCHMVDRMKKEKKKLFPCTICSYRDPRLYFLDHVHPNFCLCDEACNFIWGSSSTSTLTRENVT